MRIRTIVRWAARCGGILLALVCLTSAAPQVERVEEVAIIVNKENETTNLSMKELRAYFRLDRRTWSVSKGAAAGKDVVLYLRESGSKEQDAILEVVYEMSQEKLERYWVEKVFQGRITSAPATKGSSDSALRAVGRDAAALSFVLASAVNDKVSVLRIDDKSPGEKGYPLVIPKK